jgi:hypothetical protein
MVRQWRESWHGVLWCCLPAQLRSRAQLLVLGANVIGRTLIRGLQHLTLGVDLKGQREGSASPIIVDSKLKKAAEDFSLLLD